MNEKEIMSELNNLTKQKEKWNTSIDNVVLILKSTNSKKIKAKSLWLLGEMGLQNSSQIQDHIQIIASFLNDKEPKLRERAVNALGRIGRANHLLVMPYWDNIMDMKNDESSDVRMCFIWACENIATNSPELYSNCMDIFLELINDKNDRVRIEAPEMFRVIGKRKPKYVEPYLDKLQWFADNDLHRVVRIHSAGAVRVTKKALEATKNIDE
ncbi:MULTISPECIES: sister chromatid cohesion protein PDS5 [unclassified Treponema]|uniref:sister chromatid cohesion protein PDS5 n=1 Tax=unclassified Treponema TaxID=2638727 RepID=UPI0020A480A6|nr:MULTISPECIES: sister chromatid cohesion protein PDS5 [unclassified Treponema]UTC67897.1 HEAT repeat domain-containing protein [Treponema sp. OMZ 789]UTC70618.1 HEAT repeat domain-containing protein [Treponema sp. OMZ 790]UTC73331.1 HEAT repeat domain-containing protein [Treponema sp. OMZ 791]